MPTRTKNNKPATSSKSMRGLLPGRRTTPAPSRRFEASGSHGLLGRVQANLPSVKRNAQKSGAQKVVAALGKATTRTTAHRPSTKSMLGILAGGVGAAAVAKRRHNPDPEELPEAQPALAGDTHTPAVSETTADATATTGGDHGDPQGPDPSTAA